MIDYPTDKFFIQPLKKGQHDYQNLIDSDYLIEISNWLQRGWELFKKEAQLSIAYAVIAAIFYALLNLLVPMGGLVITLPLLAGFMIVSLRQLHSQQPEFINYFWGFRHFLPLLVFSVVSTIFITLGMMLFIIPGIYLMVAYLFAPFLII